MRPLAAALALATAPCAALCVTPAVAQTAPPDGQHAWAEDGDGQQMRVGFEPGSRWLLGSGYRPGWGSHSASLENSAYWETGIRYRHLIDFEEEAIAWKLYHRVIEGSVTLDGDGRLGVHATAYQLRFMRWTEDGSLVMPGVEPVRVSFPFNVGFETSLGRLDLAHVPDGTSSQIGVVRSEVVLDVWRQRRLGSYAQLGIGPRYDVRVLSLLPEQTPVVQHIVAPFSAGSVAFHHESDDGHHAVDVRVGGAYRLRIGTGWSPLAEAAIDYEAILLSLNDMPASAYIGAAYRYTDDPAPTYRQHEVSGSAGLRFSVPVD